MVKSNNNTKETKNKKKPKNNKKNQKLKKKESKIFLSLFPSLAKKTKAKIKKTLNNQTNQVPKIKISKYSLPKTIQKEKKQKEHKRPIDDFTGKLCSIGLPSPKKPGVAYHYSIQVNSKGEFVSAIREKIIQI